MRCLTRFFGDDGWKAFYTTYRRHSLFDEETEITERAARPEDIAKYIVGRFKTEFAAVLDPPLVLRNTKNSPMFLLCFTVGNPAGAKAGLKIAGDVVGGSIAPL